MINEKELGHIFLATLILVFVVAFKETLKNGTDYTYLLILFFFLLFIILINTLAKKSMAYRYEANLETKIWNWQRFGFKREQKLKKPIPAGAIFPPAITLLTQGSFLLLTVLESRIEGTSARASKQHGRFRFTEMTDSHIGYIVGMGVIANLLIAMFAYLINLGLLAELSIYYAAYSLIPFGNLDGTKIFFGNKNYWFILVVITLIFLSYALFIPR